MIETLLIAATLAAAPAETGLQTKFAELFAGTPATLPSDELQVRLRVNEKKALEVAEKALVEPIPDTSDALYHEFRTTGNRTHYEARFFSRLRNLDAMTLVEARESKGRFLARIVDYVNAICDMKSWVLPAHDWADGGEGTLRGTWISTDLFSTEVGAHLACVVQALKGACGAPGGCALPCETLARVRYEVERRVFGPIRREAPSVFFPDLAVPGTHVKHWWFRCESNWNAVCWDNVVCAACGLIDDPSDRAHFVALADRANDRYMASFAEDGYCSEGMGYWNYGFGHHLLTGRMLNRLTKGQCDFFRRPKERLAAAYARAYTLREGASPAFADGNGAASPLYLKLVDEFWPDLPKDLPPMSEFPAGQVWLFRDPDGLSVAFKGGHNAELHNHNDLGSYWLMDGDRFVAGDPGGEVYTARTFGGRRYESKVLSSYGHPVPVVGGRLQGTGRKFAARVISKSNNQTTKQSNTDDLSEVVLDLTAGYDVKALKALTRTFVYDRAAGTFTVRDRAVFTAPTAFEDCYVTFGEKVNVTVRATGEGEERRVVKAAEKPEEVIDNPARKAPHRFAWAFEKPVLTADVEFVFVK